MRRMAKILLSAWTVALAVYLAAPTPAEAEQLRRVKVTGEIIDSWCYLSDIMWATDSAHHQCAVWCARGGVPSASTVRRSRNSSTIY